MYIVLGALYMLCAAIGLFGVVAAYTVRTTINIAHYPPTLNSRFIFFLQQRIRLIRVYAYATALDVLLIAGTGLLQIIIHFTLKVIIFTLSSVGGADDEYFRMILSMRVLISQKMVVLSLCVFLDVAAEVFSS